MRTSSNIENVDHEENDWSEENEIAGDTEQSTSFKANAYFKNPAKKKRINSNAFQSLLPECFNFLNYGNDIDPNKTCLLSILSHFKSLNQTKKKLIFIYTFKIFFVNQNYQP